jgi:hypothetical protein
MGQIRRFGDICVKLLMHPAVAPVAGGLSAGFWFGSAFVPIPKDFFIAVPIGGMGSSSSLTILGEQLALQSLLNAFAAACAGIAAVSLSMRDAWWQDKWRRGRWWVQDQWRRVRGR